MKTVLIADDSIFMRTWLKSLLDNSKYKVVTEAKDGEEAITKYREFQTDIVLLDITMPRMNGLQALKAIKDHNPLATVIMCSALGQQTLIEEAMGNGANDFIVKPYFGDLVSTLSNAELIRS